MSHFRGADPAAPVTDTDRLLALALELFEADQCPGCGQSRTYAHDADSEKHWIAPPPTRCHACTALEAERRKHDDKPTVRALYFGVQPDEALLYAMENPLPTSPAPN